MDPKLIAILVNNFVVPEVVGLIKRHHEATGEILTEEQIKEKLNLDADALIASTDAYLASHPAE